LIGATLISGTLNFGTLIGAPSNNKLSSRSV
jgi:hypothetical protein